ncbi:hypothetical protein ACP4OV_016826 [Aristida adscensionis]
MLPSEASSSTSASPVNSWFGSGFLLPVLLAFGGPASWFR